MLFVHNNWNSFPIVFDRYYVFFCVNDDLEIVHRRIALFVVSSVNQYFVVNFIQTWCIGYIFFLDSTRFFIKNEHGLINSFNRSDCIVGQDEKVNDIEILLEKLPHIFL